MVLDESLLWTLCQDDERALDSWERKIFRNIFGPAAENHYDIRCLKYNYGTGCSNCMTSHA